MTNGKRPLAVGLYDGSFEKDGCGVGFVADLKGARSHRIVQDALRVLSSMTHRGGIGSERNSGDGAGILTALPYDFLVKVARDDLGCELPPQGRVAAGLVFLPRDESERAHCRKEVERIISSLGHRVLGWRVVPTDADGADLGNSARSGEPCIEQLFVAASEEVASDDFERHLFVIRKEAGHLLRGSSLEDAHLFYICSLSTKVHVYKGQLLAEQLLPYFKDLGDPDFQSHLAMVHSRFSTNTFPSWDRAQPNRFTCHNGEINTLRGNINWMHAREGQIRSEVLGDLLGRVIPVVEPDCSDSGNLDNVLEFLLMNGRSLPEAVTMMIPEAWQNHESMPSEKRAYYEFQSCLMEPWDGPASIVFTDGDCIGAVLDRNGLRPSRYWVTSDDRVIMASEVGVLPIDPKDIVRKGRLQPGRMFLVDFREGRIVADEEVKGNLAGSRPYADWLQRQAIRLEELPPAVTVPTAHTQDLLQRKLAAFGFTVETFNFMLLPLVREGRDPVGSMGNDSALACLSDKPRLLYDYFKQLFAQVTNPAIDSIREELIMSLRCFVGPEGNLLETCEGQAHRLEIPHPILTNEELARITSLGSRDWETRIIDVTWPVSESTAGMRTALDRICEEAENAISEGCRMLLLSDRKVDESRVSIPALLACGAVHHHLVKKSLRTRVGILIETGEAREVHHHCLLIGYGADAVNPYLAFEALWKASMDGLLPGFDSEEKIVKSYRKAVAKGMLKVLAKMGISTLQSYKGAQIFEAIGLANEVVERCFTGTASRIKGIGLDMIAEESLRRHLQGFPAYSKEILPALPNPGEFHWREGGEQHAWSPEIITHLQESAKKNSRDAYRRFSRLVNEIAGRSCTLRGLLRFKTEAAQPVPLEQVEPAARIVRRFCTGAMSFGSISAEAHETLAVAMNRVGGRSNTGEGGEDPRRFLPLSTGDSLRSSIKQVASGRFGVTLWYLANGDELQIKIAQGAKPGEGGELPGHKVDETIARIRHSTPGVGLISPPPHHDIYSIEDLKQLIHDLKNANPRARISVKLVSEVGVGTIAAGVVKAHADHVVISGHDGGTGASPITSIKHAGLPWELGLAETHQTLVLNNLRSRVVVQTDGGLRTGRDVAVAALLGAEEYAFSTAPLVTLGCIMMRKCHLNTCPVGVATQDPELRRRFQGRPEHLINYLFLVAEEVRGYMAELGFRTMDEMIGRADLLAPNVPADHPKASQVDLAPLLTPAHTLRPEAGNRCTITQDHGLDKALDNKFIDLMEEQLQKGELVRIESPVRNTNRTVGTLLSHRVAELFGENGLPDRAVHLRLKGSAGQSLGSWMARGVTLELEGDANDYVGKGLSGGRLIVYPPRDSKFEAEKNILIGNVALYGATSGEAYFRGVAAERFCVRNSGATAVVEGVGDHGCEYMTGGRVVVLGPTGRNFAAGMSGGIAYVWDPSAAFETNCNLQMVELEELENEKEIAQLRDFVEKHYLYTGSAVAGRILTQWTAALGDFVKVIPVDYKRVLEKLGSTTEAAA